MSQAAGDQVWVVVCTMREIEEQVGRFKKIPLYPRGFQWWRVTWFVRMNHLPRTQFYGLAGVVGPKCWGGDLADETQQDLIFFVGALTTSKNYQIVALRPFGKKEKFGISSTMIRETKQILEGYSTFRRQQRKCWLWKRQQCGEDHSSQGFATHDAPVSLEYARVPDQKQCLRRWMDSKDIFLLAVWQTSKLIDSTPIELSDSRAQLLFSNQGLLWLLHGDWGSRGLIEAAHEKRTKTRCAQLSRYDDC